MAEENKDGEFTPPPVELVGRAKTAVYALYGMAILSGLAALISWGELSLIQSGLNGELITRERAAGIDASQATVDTFWIIGYIATAIVFIAWLREAYSISAELNADAMRYSKRWTIWGWLLPIVFLVIPYLIVQDIAETIKQKPGASIAPLVSGWWALWLFMNAFSYASFHILGDAASNDLEVVYTSSLFGLLSNLCAVTAAILAAKMVRRIHGGMSKRQASIEDISVNPVSAA